MATKEQRGRVVVHLALSLFAATAFIAAFGVARADAVGATVTVTNCNDTGTGSLRQAITAAASGTTVTFALAPACPTITLQSTLDIATNLIIDGPGSATLALDELPYTTVFDVAADVKATISGLTIDNGSVGIDNDGNLTVSDDTLSGAGSSAGGGILNQGTLTVTGSTVSNNGVTAGAGAGGGGIENEHGTVTVSSSTFADNTASAGAEGGGIDNDGGSVTISGSALNGNNTGQGSGGGIVNRDDGTLVVTTSTLADNSAVDGTGGGIENEGGTVTVSDSTLSHNTAFYGSGGGGIFNATAASVSIADSTLIGNGATYGGDGGAVFNLGSLSITGSTLDRNTSTDDGGGLFSAGGSLTVTATIIASSKRGDCFGPVTDGGYNLVDDTTCNLSAGTDKIGTPAGLDPTGLADNGGPTRTIGLESTSPAVGAVGSATVCSTPDQRGVTRPTPCDTGAVQFVLPPQTFTSADTTSVAAGSPLSFTVTTSGTPVPTIKRRGRLPRHVRLVDNGNGTATLSGTPDRTGTFHLTLRALYGTGAHRPVVTQGFTLVVTAP